MKTQIKVADVVNNEIMGAFSALEDALMADTRELERITNEIKALQNKLKSLNFQMSEGETTINAGDAKIGYSFKKKTIFYLSDAGTQVSLAAAPTKIRKDAYVALPKLMHELKEAHEYRKLLEAEAL